MFQKHRIFQMTPSSHLFQYHTRCVSNIVWFQCAYLPHWRVFFFRPPPPPPPIWKFQSSFHMYLYSCLWELPNSPGIFNPLPYNYNSFIPHYNISWASLLTSSTSDYCQSITSTYAVIFVGRCISFASHLYQKIWMKHGNFQRSCWVLECPYQSIRSITI